MLSIYPHDFYNIHFLVRDQTLLSREACVFFYSVFQYFFFPKKKTTLWFLGSFKAIEMFRFRKEMLSAQHERYMRGNHERKNDHSKKKNCFLEQCWSSNTEEIEEDRSLSSSPTWSTE